MVFGDEEDTLWTMAALPSELGLAHTQTPLAACEGFDAILPWGQSSEIPAFTDTQQGLVESDVDDSECSWQERLWLLRAQGSCAAASNDRRLCLGLGIEEEYLLPERTVVASMEALDEYIAHRALGPDDTWVAKAPWAASGRERVRRRGRKLESEMRVRTQRLLERYGELLIEPWMHRLADYGVAGIVGAQAGEHRVFPAHQLHSDKTGVFRGIRIADLETEAKLGSTFAEALAQSAHSTAAALFAAGYRGPFGIDAFVYKDSAGRERLQSLCEINARLCFGLVARAQAEKLGQGDFDFTL